LKSLLSASHMRTEAFSPSVALWCEIERKHHWFSHRHCLLRLHYSPVSFSLSLRRDSEKNGTIVYLSRSERDQTCVPQTSPRRAGPARPYFHCRINNFQRANELYIDWHNKGGPFFASHPREHLDSIRCDTNTLHAHASERESSKHPSERVESLDPQFIVRVSTGN
jgi:hypothetical protein